MTTQPYTPDDLTRDRAAIAKASREPWSSERDYWNAHHAIKGGDLAWCGMHSCEHQPVIGEFKRYEDSEFAATARTNFPRALDALERAWSEIEQLKQERDDADRRAGAAERSNEYLKDSQSRRSAWLSAAKAEAGYSDNTSFDVVWKETLAKTRTLAEEIDRLKTVIRGERHMLYQYHNAFGVGGVTTREEWDAETARILGEEQ